MTLPRWFERVIRPWRSRAIRDEIQEELRFHMDLRVAENLRAGMSVEAAQQDAAHRFGSPTVAAEAGFDVKGAAWWDDTVADVRYAVRLLLKHKAFAATALAAMALGTGANVAVYGALNAVLLRPLPYSKADRLALIRQQQTRAGRDDMSFSVAEIGDYRRGTGALDGLAEYFTDVYLLRSGTNPGERVQTGIVSSNFFHVFGVEPQIGRSFSAADEQPGAPPVVLLSHEYWTRNHHGDPAVVGRSLSLNSTAFTIIGILPPLPSYPDANDVFITTASSAFRMWPERIRNRNRRFAQVFGRLKNGVTFDGLNANLAVVANGLRQQYPHIYQDAWGYRAIATPVREEIERRARAPIWLLTAAALFILAIVCSNVANMTLARLAQREQELAMREALGASRGRMFRQLFTECGVLAAVATLLGLGLALASTDLLRRLLEDVSPRAADIDVDRSSLAFALLMTAAVTVATTVGVAIAARQRAVARTNGGRQFSSNVRQARVRSALIAAQVAFSLVLLGGAATLVRSFLNLERVDSGVTRDAVLTMHLDFDVSRYRVPADQRAASRDILRAISVIPGVANAAVSSSFPLDPIAVRFGLNGDWNRYQVFGRLFPPGQLPPVTPIRVVSTAYFSTLGIPLLRGRTFTDADRLGAPPVAIVNQAFARDRFGGADPVGRRLTSDAGTTWFTVVGVVGDTAERDLREAGSDEAYFPLEQLQQPSGDWVRALAIRSSGAAPVSAADVRNAIARLTPDVAVSHVETLRQAHDASLVSERLMTILLLTFAGIALVVAVSGVGGMVALSVGQRTQEIGLRRTLGARPLDIVYTIVRRELAAVTVGLVAGVTLVAMFSGSLTAFAFEITPADPSTIAGVSVLFIAAAVAACGAPLGRALAIDPNVALRQE